METTLTEFAKTTFTSVNDWPEADQIALRKELDQAAKQPGKVMTSDEFDAWLKAQ